MTELATFNHTGWERDAEREEAAHRELRRLGWNPDVALPHAYRRGPLTALVGREPARDGTERWHVTVQHGNRTPSWRELADAAQELRPGVCFVLAIPPRWVLDPHESRALHLWETTDRALVGALTERPS